MLFTKHILAFLVFVVATVLAAPVSIHRRAANLQISLHETGKNTDHWHFGLVIHPPGGINGNPVTIHEHVLKSYKGCMDYKNPPRSHKTRADQLPVTGDLHAAHGEKDDAALDAAVVAIVEQVPGSAITRHGFKNCFDFAVEAVQGLNTAHYVSQADYKKFSDYHTAHAASVHAKTDAVAIGAVLH